MSTLKVDTIQKADGSGSLSVPAESGTVVTTASPSLGRRNLIINGAMQVAQRGISSTATSGYNTVDRLKFDLGGTITSTQSSDAPEGFSNSYKLEVTGAASSGALGIIWSNNEGQNFQMLKYGTANAETMSLSFWVKSSVAGRYTANLLNRTTSLTFCTNSYTIDSANTWEYKTLTFVGDTSKSIENSNANIIDLEFWTNTGSAYTSGTFTDGGTAWTGTGANRVHPSQASVLETSGATWQITGVQLEVGSVATPFEHRSYGEELALCQRYYYKTAYHARMSVDAKNTYLTSNWFGFPVFMRAAPTISLSFPWTGGNFNSGLLSKTTEAGISVGITGNGNTAGYAACDVAFSADAEL